MADYEGNNLRRLMARSGLTVEQVARKAGLDTRTVSGILDGAKRAQPRTIGRLAEGLEVSVDEFFVNPGQLACRSFDRLTNPAIEQAVEDHPKLFADWTAADFNELESRFGIGGPLTTDGALSAAEQMNRKRELQEKLALLLETGHGEAISTILDVLYEKVVSSDK